MTRSKTHWLLVVVAGAIFVLATATATAANLAPPKKCPVVGGVVRCSLKMTNAHAFFIYGSSSLNGNTVKFDLNCGGNHVRHTYVTGRIINITAQPLALIEAGRQAWHLMRHRSCSLTVQAFLPAKLPAGTSGLTIHVRQV